MSVAVRYPLMDNVGNNDLNTYSAPIQDSRNVFLDTLAQSYWILTIITSGHTSMYTLLLEDYD